MVHRLKAWRQPFEATWQGRKPYECRGDYPHGGYQVDDTLALIEWDEDADRQLSRWMEARVTYVSRGPGSGIPEGHVVMGIDVRMRVVEPPSPPDVYRPHPLARWHEDIGPVLWWKVPIAELPRVGIPLDPDWPGYHTHWTPLIVPDDLRPEPA